MRWELQQAGALARDSDARLRVVGCGAELDKVLAVACDLLQRLTYSIK